MPYQAPRGTHDVLPTESHHWQWLEREFLSLAGLYGYQEIRTPVFEDTELFVRSSGETSEVVSKQMYSFQDKGGRDITLRPEETAPAMRAVIEHNLCPQGMVCRLSYVSSIYRYERPQKGRLREAHQVGLELMGVPSVAADAEIIEITVRFYQRLGLSEVKVSLNSLGRSECRSRYRDALLRHAEGYIAAQAPEIQERIKKNPLRLLDSKDADARELIEKAPSILDCLEEECRVRFEALQCLLDEARIPFTVDPAIVRGLDYYTETVFEVVSSELGAQSSLCGGGRYDNLCKDLGGPNLPSVGVAMGIERALIVLEAKGLLPARFAPAVFVAYTGDSTRREAFRIAAELRSNGISTVIDLEGKSLRAQLRQADRVQSKTVVLVGEEEMAKGEVVLRNLEGGEQHAVQLTAILSALGPRL